MMAVEDPDEEGDATEEDVDAAFVGIARLHAANLLASLGQVQLSAALRDAASLNFVGQTADALSLARRTLDAASTAKVSGESTRDEVKDDLVGGYVTRAGPLADAPTPVDQETLQRLALRPLFVGIERKVLEALVAGDVDTLRAAAVHERTSVDSARPDRAGTWVIELGRSTTVA
jgi:hypothetical protein